MTSASSPASPSVARTARPKSTVAGVDRAARIRAFLRTVYPSAEWGVEDVLLVGDPSDVPMRECCIDLGYGRPLTDFYYAELSADDASSWAEAAFDWVSTFICSTACVS